MNEDDKKLMAYAQAIFDHCQKQGRCSGCLFRYKEKCAIKYPDVEWDWRLLKGDDENDSERSN